MKEENKEVTITLKYISDEYVGKKGTIAIESEPDSSDFNIVDTTKNIVFQASLINGENKYQVDCGF